MTYLLALAWVATLSGLELGKKRRQANDGPRGGGAAASRFAGRPLLPSPCGNRFSGQSGLSS